MAVWDPGRGGTAAGDLVSRLICVHCGEFVIPLVKDEATSVITGFYCLNCGRIGIDDVRKVDT